MLLNFYPFYYDCEKRKNFKVKTIILSSWNLNCNSDVVYLYRIVQELLGEHPAQCHSQQLFKQNGSSAKSAVPKSKQMGENSKNIAHTKVSDAAVQSTTGFFLRKYY